MITGCHLFDKEADHGHFVLVLARMSGSGARQQPDNWYTVGACAKHLLLVAAVNFEQPWYKISRSVIHAVNAWVAVQCINEVVHLAEQLVINDLPTSTIV